MISSRRCLRYDADMPHPSWNESYASGEPLPWDTGTPDPLLVEMIESRAIAPGRTLEVGCGTGTNAIFLAQHGFDVLGVDISASPSRMRAPRRTDAVASRRSISWTPRRPAGRSTSCSTAAAFTSSTTMASAPALRRTWRPSSSTRLVAEPDRQHRRRAAR